MREIVVATENPGKLREIRESLGDTAVQILSLTDLPPLPPVKEDGSTFRENALIKARTVAHHTGRLTIADDSGLEVDHLEGKPGVRSARFAGEEASDAENNRKLLKLLAGVPPAQRGAVFRCVIAVAEPGGGTYTAEGVCEGEIAFGPQGDLGFGYDPVFLLFERERTMAQLPPEEKNRISHRARAAQAIRPVLERLVGRDHVSGKG